MNDQIKYSLQGSLLALLFFVGIAYIQFLVSLKTSPAIEVVRSGSGNPPVASQKYTDGNQLFNDMCASCHHPGLAIAGIEKRVPDKKLLYAWIRNSKSVLASGDKYFNALYKAYDKMPMPSFPDLTDEQIDSMLDFVANYAGAVSDN